MDVRAAIYGALTADTSLTKLAKIYMNDSKDSTTLPAVVVSIIDEVPHFADNGELLNVVRFQVTIITDDAEYDSIEALVKADMYGISATRVMSAEFLDEKKHYRVVQFKIIVETDRSE